MKNLKTIIKRNINKAVKASFHTEIEAAKREREFYYKECATLKTKIIEYKEWQNELLLEMIDLKTHIEEAKTLVNTNYSSLFDELKNERRNDKEELHDKIQILAREINRLKWNEIDENEQKHQSENDELVCGICGYKGRRADYKTKISRCIFNGGRLERYICPDCDVIFGPTKFSNLSQEDRDADYSIHYIAYSEGNSVEKELKAFFLLEPDKECVYLDYGCGCWSGTVEKLRADGYRIYGYEPYAVDNKNPFIISNKHTLSKMRFDGIFSNDLLEHLIDPISDLKFMKSLLRTPDSKMAHSTSCYSYKYEYTRFHTFFYTGKSSSVLSESVGLKIVAEVDELETEDFICKVFAPCEDTIAYIPLLSVLGRKVNLLDEIVLEPEEILIGPYIDLEQGITRWLLNITWNDSTVEVLYCNVTGDNGQKLITEIELRQGGNQITLSLSEPETRVEFTIKNITDNLVGISRLDRLRDAER